MVARSERVTVVIAYRALVRVFALENGTWLYRFLRKCLATGKVALVIKVVELKYFLFNKKKIYSDLSAVAVERVPRAARHVPHAGEGADGVVASVDV